MLSSQRRSIPRVIDRLLADPHRYEFFQAVRLLSRWLSVRDGQGEHDILAQRLRFRSSLSLSFPASEVEDLQVVRTGTQEPDCANAERFEITPAFMGLLGVHGTLPLHYTETLVQRELLGRDGAARAFLEIFNHRAVALFYLAWKKHRLALAYESDRVQGFLPLVLSLAGLGQEALRNRLLERPGAGLHDESIAHYAGTLQRRQVSASQLEAWVGAHFGVSARIESFVGRWVRLPPSALSVLGRSGAVLGRSAVVGERIWQRDLRVRLRLGPLDRERYSHFLPGAAGAHALQSLLKLVYGVSLEFEIRLCLRRQDVLPTALHSQAGGVGARLGWSTFLCSRPVRHDRDDLAYDMLSAA
ncbi:MAG: type VI secretion system baseplate subunit TssG [Caldimonas sp.]|uniref:type VI secretion system baseplate subunit TssG n=1 Tax=Caldimonas sp. TaxID=2838790 RepID=UPI00391AC449